MQSPPVMRVPCMWLAVSFKTVPCDAAWHRDKWCDVCPSVMCDESQGCDWSERKLLHNRSLPLRSYLITGDFWDEWPLMSDHWWVMTRCGPRDPWLWLSDPASANNIPNIKVFACSVKTQITYTWGQGVFLFENYQEVLEVLICSLAWHFVTLESLDTRKIISIENVLSYYLLLV